MRNSVRLLFFVTVQSRVSDVDGIDRWSDYRRTGGETIENLISVECKYKFCSLVSILQCYDSSMKRADKKGSSENGSGMGDYAFAPSTRL
jgi:hypothetical protein